MGIPATSWRHLLVKKGSVPFNCLRQPKWHLEVQFRNIQGIFSFFPRAFQKSVSPLKYFWPSMDMCEKLLEVGNRTFEKKQTNPRPSMDMCQKKKTSKWQKQLKKGLCPIEFQVLPSTCAINTSTRVFFHLNSASSHGRVRKRPRSGILQLNNVSFSIGSHCPPMDIWEKHLQVANRALRKGVFSTRNPCPP